MNLQEFMVIIPLIVCITGFCISLVMHFASDKLGRKVCHYCNVCYYAPALNAPYGRGH